MLTAGVNVSTPVDEHLRNVSLAFRRRPHERCLALPVARNVHRCPFGQQRVHDFHVSGARPGHQDGLTTRKSAVGVRSCAQQDGCHIQTGIESGQGQWGHTQLVQHIDVGPRFDQELGRLGVVPVCGPV